jgi:uncharacterized protein (TIGR03437 family)
MRLIALLAALASASFSATRLPITFEPNRGQEPGSDFVARTREFTVGLRAGRIRLDSSDSHFTTVLAGARRNARPEAEGRLPGVVHYLGRYTNIPTYSRVRYRGIYPGIDAVYYGKEGRLEYDFVLSPGADPHRIRLRYDGVTDLRLDASGDLLAGGLRQHRPVAYQEIAGERRQIASRYVLSGRTVRFEIGAYDRTRPLVIDPALTWASYFAYPGAGGTLGEGVAVDATGNIYICGSVVDPNYGYDAFVAKLSPDGTQVLFKSLFGPPNLYNMQAHSIAVDGSGNLVVVGQADSPQFGTLVTSAFIFKTNPTGAQLIYGSLFGGSIFDVAYSVAVDSSGNAYVTGTTASPDFPVGGTGSVQTRLGGGSDAFLTKVDSSGKTLLYSTFLGGAGNDVAYSVAVDPAGNVYVAGTTSSTNFPVSLSAYQSKLAGTSDAFVTAFTASGGLLYSTYLGGGGDDIAYGIAVDSAGAAYVTGETTSTDFPTLTPAQAVFGGGKGDIFVAKFNTGGSTLAYSTYWGGTGEEGAYGIAVDGTGSAYAIGFTGSSDLPVSNAFQSTNQGAGNAVVLGLDPAGAAVFSSYLGGSGNSSTSDYGNSVAVSCASGLVAAGVTGSTNFPATTGAAATAFSGAALDGFVARIGIGGTPVVDSTGVVNGASLTAGPLAPGSVASILGSSLSGATVAVNGNAVPVISAGAGRVDFQVPNEVAVGSATATVTNGCGTTSPATFQVAQAAPYVRLRANGDALATNQDNSDNSAANPAKSGTVVVVSLTGIGPVDNPVATGTATPSSPFSKATLPVTATIGGWDATVQFIGLTPGTVGMAQANLVVPGLSPGAYAVVVTVGGVASNEATVYVQ